MLVVLLLPILNFLVLFIFGRWLGKVGSVYFILLSSFFLLGVTSKIYLMLLVSGVSFDSVLGMWINVSFLSAQVDVWFDMLSTTMLLMVTIVSLFVQCYSVAYMCKDPHFIRFMSYLSLFTFFMFTLVTASNLLQLFLGWEGVGLCSYLIINFWFTRVQANKAAIKALFMNRIGDIGYLLGVVLVFTVFKTFHFAVLGLLVDISICAPVFPKLTFVYCDILYYDVIAMCFFVGVVGKSAQITLHTWLPAAMEGPTPVSALIHAATMVTAGVFLLIRVSFLFSASPKVQAVVVVIGSVTAVLSALTAITVFDIKKIIAYSTCSQLGYMVVACGLAQYNTAFFHLINHAFFKAILFLTAGAVIHSCSNEQDIRKLSNLFPFMPLAYVGFIIGNVAIMGFPFLSGFYSKDLIIEFSFLAADVVWVSGATPTYLLFIFIVLATFFTGIYSFRLFYFLFLRNATVHKNSLSNRSKSQPVLIRWVLGLLILGSTLVGYCLSEIFTAGNSFFLSSSSATVLQSFESEFIPWYIKLFPLVLNGFVAACGIVCVWVYQKGIFGAYYRWFLVDFVQTWSACFDGLTSWFFYVLQLLRGPLYSFVFSVSRANFYFNEIYNYCSLVVWHTSYIYVFLNFDKGALEMFGPTGASRLYSRIVSCITYLYKVKIAQQVFIFINAFLLFLLCLHIFV